MGFLTIISETGMFHSVSLFEFELQRRLEWRGFHPVQHRSPAGRGEVDRSNRQAFINHYIRFSVDDQILGREMSKVERMYENAEYVLGRRDCVSMSADVVRQCFLAVPLVNFTPFGLIEILRVN